MKKCISTAALTAVVAMFSQVQASQAATVEERLEAVEKKLEGTSSGNFITAAKKKVDVTLYGQVNTGTGIAGSSHCKRARKTRIFCKKNKIFLT
jgi:hypothetical protein